MATALDKLLLGMKANRERMVSRSQRLAQDQARATSRRHFGSDYKESDAADDMINIDSPTTYTINETKQKNGLGTLAKVATCGALLATGAGLGAIAPIAIPAIAQLFKSETEPTTPETTIDTRNVYQLKLGDPND